MIFASVLDDQVYPLPILSLLGIVLITSLKTLLKLLKRNYHSINQQEHGNEFTGKISEVIADTNDEDNSTKEINKHERIENRLQIASVSSAEQELSEEGFILEDERIESAEEFELDGIEEDYEEDTLVQDEQDNLSIITAIEVELDLTNNLPGLVHPQDLCTNVVSLISINKAGRYILPAGQQFVKGNTL
ncbi:unnamed protein product [Hymenolepis diminuta]|uniref:Uncharacterized protein n=1 Tax=Hymenolepis diminuta TaxID=6216 RepID=A0A564Y7W8_HYMDI|nr:unnamed protein product [Hymenolepis diminuta]VUZ43039.1 unnamed protein product [Hymenolepis diminuta]VUZ45657.1 unnamed protein product [Hymenolepis diminuta]